VIWSENERLRVSERRVVEWFAGCLVFCWSFLQAVDRKVWLAIMATLSRTVDDEQGSRREEEVEDPVGVGH
jgi:hypothetical protein